MSTEPSDLSLSNRELDYPEDGFVLEDHEAQSRYEYEHQDDDEQDRKGWDSWVGESEEFEDSGLFRDRQAQRVRIKETAKKQRRKVIGTKRDETEDQGRRKTIYDLDSYGVLMALGTTGSHQSFSHTGTEEQELVRRYSESLGIPGVLRVDLSPLTQKIVGCVIDENVTTEFPWVYVRKEIIEDNIDLHSESSDFLPVKDDIKAYPEGRMLVGYAPSGDHEGQFYICLTEESRMAVAQRIEALRLEQQERVRNAINKLPSAWQNLGSEHFIEDMTVRRNRPLFEIEVESTANQLKAPPSLTDRSSGDQRDGYLEIDPHRDNFENVAKLLVDRQIQEIPVTKDSDAQTLTVHSVNSWCECHLDEETVGEPTDLSTKLAQRELARFVKNKYEEIFGEVEANTTWDVYANDYAKLALEAADMVPAARPSAKYAERQSYYDGKLCSGRVINDLNWHPTWSGVAVAAYTSYGKSETLIGPRPPQDIEHAYQVFVWSFDDCLKPKLILDSKREVTAVSYCPHNGNIVVGGCANGQIVLWDITGKMELVEKVVVRTAAQARHATTVKDLSLWMKEDRDKSVILPTATSALQHSQKDAITKIEWVPPHEKIDDRGRFHDLPEDTPEEEFSMQFATSSEDGSIAFYDLKWTPPVKKTTLAQPKKKKTVQKPRNLLQSISPFKGLDGVWKPIYQVIVQPPFQTRNVIITTISFRPPLLRKEQVEPFPRTDDVTVRRYYKVVPEKPDVEYRPRRETIPQKTESDESVPEGEAAKPPEGPPAEIFVGTARGECGIISWEGYEFSTGITVNMEVCKWNWMKQVHDGPISHAVRSKFLPYLLLTVGGRVFALWSEQFSEPFLWRKAECRYTACSWDNERPSVAIVGRSDGTIEIWNFLVKSHEPSITQSLSGRIITGIYAHELPLSPQCVGFCDYNGALRIFLAPKVSLDSQQSDVEWMRQFVDREVSRIDDFLNWQRDWNKMMAEREKEEAAEAGPKLTEAELKLREEAAQLEASRAAKARHRKLLVEEMRARWVTRELQRMERAILVKKGLREEELERRREPVLRMQREARQKEAKRQAVFAHAEDLFEEAVTANFPQQKHKLLTPLSLPPGKDQPEQQSPITTPIGDHKTEEDEIIHEYEEIEREALEKMRQRSHQIEFSWRKLIDEGIRRRRSIDVKLKAHRMRLMQMMPSSLFSMESYEASGPMGESTMSIPQSSPRNKLLR